MSKIKNKELKAIERKFDKILSLIDKYLLTNNNDDRQEINQLLTELNLDIKFLTTATNYRIPLDGIAEEDENQ
jgi:DNA-directed RNA polymerase delta subunit